MTTLDKQIFIQQVTKDSEAEGGIITTEQLQTIILNNLKNFDMVQENNGRVSLDYLEAFINAKFIEGRTNKTLKRYDYIIKRMLNLLNVNEQDITVYHLRKYFTMQKEKGISERTLNGERCIFSSYFGWLFNEHRFRRTLATTLINHGMPIQEVAHILGHEKIDTTMEYVYIENENVKVSYKKYA